MYDIDKHYDLTLTFLIVPVILGWMLRGARTQAIKRDGVKWLEYGKVMKGAAFFIVGMFALLCAGWFTVPPEKRGQLTFVVILMGLGSLSQVMEFFLVRIGFDHHKIYCHSAWRRKRTIDWDEVVSFEFSELSHWWIIRTSKSGRINVSRYISGVPDLLKELHRQRIKRV